MENDKVDVCLIAPYLVIIDRGRVVWRSNVESAGIKCRERCMKHLRKKGYKVNDNSRLSFPWLKEF
jgi:hypothetical protein